MLSFVLRKDQSSNPVSRVPYVISVWSSRSANDVILRDWPIGGLRSNKVACVLRKGIVKSTTRALCSVMNIGAAPISHSYEHENTKK